MNEDALGRDARFFEFPSIGLTDQTVVTGVPAGPGEAGGDVAVLMEDTDAGQRLVRYLATPAAAEPWVRHGGFVSPNKSVDLGLYRDPMLAEAARSLVEAPSLRFDLSDLLAPAFGSTKDGGMWKVLQDFLAAPGDVDGTARRLEEAYRATAR